MILDALVILRPISISLLAKQLLLIQVPMLNANVLQLLLRFQIAREFLRKIELMVK